MRCRICNSDQHLMARCPQQGKGSGSSSSFAGWATSSTAFLSDPSQQQGAASGRRVSFDDHSASGSAPPWDATEQMSHNAPPGYLMLTGDASETELEHVFMINSSDDRLYTNDPWGQAGRGTPTGEPTSNVPRPQAVWPLGRHPPPVPPTLTDRVIGTAQAVDRVVTQGVTEVA